MNHRDVVNIRAVKLKLKLNRLNYASLGNFYYDQAVGVGDMKN